MGRIAADSSVFYAIADPTRRAILDLLREQARAGVGEEGRTVMVMLDRIGLSIAGLSQSGFSQHLAVLLRAGLVTVKRRGRLRIYALRAKPLEEIADWVAEYDKFWSEKLEGLGRYLDSHHVRSVAGAQPKTRKQK